MPKSYWLAAGLFLACSACSDSDLEISTTSTGGGPPPSLIEIYTPNSGDTLPANTPITVEYAVVRGGDGTYVEIQVDQRKPARVAQTRGRHLMPGLPPGHHTITVKEYDAKGKPTGGRTAVTIEVK